MVAVERTSRYAEISCAICHERFKPGELVLPSIRNGRHRAIHAHVCHAKREERSASSDIEVAAVA